MPAFTIEDIEMIRRKSGISYQEAVALLDYHNGNVARALVDLERNGRIKEGNDAPKETKGFSATVNGKPVTKSTFMQLLHKGYRARFKVSRGESSILNISLLFFLLALLISPHLLVVGVILCMVLGYKITFDKHDHAFDGENLERTVRTAADNVKHSVSDFAKSFQTAEEPKAAPAEESAEEERSYYSAKRPEPTYRPSCPTLNVPVQVESQDGSVTIEADSEGYASATIE